MSVSDKATEFIIVTHVVKSVIDLVHHRIASDVRVCLEGIVVSVAAYWFLWLHVNLTLFFILVEELKLFAVLIFDAIAVAVRTLATFALAICVL